LLWIGISHLLNWYLRHFGNYNRIYGTLGAVIALLLWLYVTALAILWGAELNAELIRQKEAKDVVKLASTAAGRSIS
jgi:membrane protein